MKKIKMKYRKFHKGEKVFVCDYDNRFSYRYGFGTLVADNIIKADSIVKVLMEDEKGKTRSVNVLGDKIYKIAPRISKKVGEVVCYEHIIFEKGHNYPFYLPNNDENYYRFELGL